jgi:hypothetical protein
MTRSRQAATGADATHASFDKVLPVPPVSRGREGRWQTPQRESRELARLVGLDDREPIVVRKSLPIPGDRVEATGYGRLYTPRPQRVAERLCLELPLQEGESGHLVFRAEIPDREAVDQPRSARGPTWRGRGDTKLTKRGQKPCSRCRGDPSHRRGETGQPREVSTPSKSVPAIV